MINTTNRLFNPLFQPPSLCTSMSLTITSLNNTFSSSSYRYRYVNASVNARSVFLYSRKSVRDRVNPIRVYSESKERLGMSISAEEKQVRKYSPLLESPFPLEHNVSTTEFKTIPDIWRSAAERFGDRVALVDPHHDPPTNMTYKQVEQDIINFSEGLRVIGIKPCEKLALFADNSCRWLIADQGIMATGAINVVRGSRSSVEELLHIYNHSESVALAVDNPELYLRMADAFNSKASVKFVILLWGEKSSISSQVKEGIPAYTYKEIIDIGRGSRASFADSHDAQEQYVYEPIKSDDVAALIYTSGTTGNPKGVMLTHNNLLHQVHNLWDIVPAGPGDRFLSMLPPWHAYERACEYFILSLGIEQVYTTVKHLKDDLREYQPQYMISVPLVFQTLYSGIQKQISTSSAIRKLIAVSLIRISMAYMEFKNIYEGKYLSRNPKQPSFIAAILDWLYARAGISGGGSLPMHVDKFFENPNATNQALDEDGWLNTGDIGWISPVHSVGRSRNSGGIIVLEGRAKDTIVLSTGENVEPEQLEEAAMRSSLIQQIVVIGQDKRRLGAIIVPNKEEILLAFKKSSTSDSDTVELSKEKITGLLSEELRKWTSDCSFQIGPILIVEEPFTIDSGLMTATMKIRRNQVVELYKEQIDDLYK
ncbi:hypothetical protein M8C21_022758 [Ambrosia artemisiifolia]|uniref:AMP-dependent synthetase/ligase domain-containing protein n=1 Tax=Ambrosia artemisiifolia TaxID=4212 RepID=A0AAD5D4Z5_AMBAR|nr:hypothetical protein M8C21_022758 [Ambrosia artemisiifolia]